MLGDHRGIAIIVLAQHRQLRRYQLFTHIATTVKITAVPRVIIDAYGIG